MAKSILHLATGLWLAGLLLLAGCAAAAEPEPDTCDGPD